MELFFYRNADINTNPYLSFWLWMGGAGLVLMVGLIIYFVRRKHYENFFAKLFRNILYILILTLLCGGCTVFGVLSWVNTSKAKEQFEKYDAKYRNGEYKTVSGEVTNFYEHADESKTFIIDGVTFTLYPSSVATPYYSYKPSRTQTNYHSYYSGSFNYYYTTTTYLPEECVITQTSPPLEIHYIEEGGKLLIFYIKEITE